MLSYPSNARPPNASDAIVLSATPHHRGRKKETPNFSSFHYNFNFNVIHRDTPIFSPSFY